MGVCFLINTYRGTRGRRTRSDPLCVSDLSVYIFYFFYVRVLYVSVIASQIKSRFNI